MPYGTVEEWFWLGPVLLEAIQADPDVMLPQLLIALNTELSRGRDIQQYDFDQHVLTAWFGDRAREILQLVARGFPIRSRLTAQSQYLLKAAISKATALCDAPVGPG